MFRTGEVVSDLPQLHRRTRTPRARWCCSTSTTTPACCRSTSPRCNADFAVGGSYKYTRGGPGACWLYVRPGLVDTLRTPDTGWFAKKDMFTYARPEPPEFAPGGDAWLESTPPVLAPIQALAGLELTLELGVERIREHNLEQKKLPGLAATGSGRRGRGARRVRHPEASRRAGPRQQPARAQGEDRRARRLPAPLPGHPQSAQRPRDGGDQAEVAALEALGAVGLPDRRTAARRVTISPISRPVTGPSVKPWCAWPKANHRPPWRGARPMTGIMSGVHGREPIHGIGVEPLGEREQLARDRLGAVELHRRLHRRRAARTRRRW